jgi:hypothetical protein
MQFMTPHITKNRHQESNFGNTEEGMALSGENEEDTQMNGKVKLSCNRP